MTMLQCSLSRFSPDGFAGIIFFLGLLKSIKSMGHIGHWKAQFRLLLS